MLILPVPIQYHRIFVLLPYSRTSFSLLKEKLFVIFVKDGKKDLIQERPSQWDFALGDTNHP
jgi:hypothetical protein